MKNLRYFFGALDRYKVGTPLAKRRLWLPSDGGYFDPFPSFDDPAGAIRFPKTSTGSPIQKIDVNGNTVWTVDHLDIDANSTGLLQYLYWADKTAGRIYVFAEMGADIMLAYIDEATGAVTAFPQVANIGGTNMRVFDRAPISGNLVLAENGGGSTNLTTSVEISTVDGLVAVAEGPLVQGGVGIRRADYRSEDGSIICSFETWGENSTYASAAALIHRGGGVAEAHIGSNGGFMPIAFRGAWDDEVVFNDAIFARADFDAFLADVADKAGLPA